MKLQLHGAAGKDLQVSELAFGRDFNEGLVHQVVTAYMAAGRAGTKAQKTRADVRGGGAKPWRQKGTGRARRGDIKSPLLRGGGVVFGPDGRKYKYQVPKKVKKLALKMALSSKLSAKELVVLDRFDLEEIKTREFVGTLDALKLESALIVTDKKNENLEMSSRNVRGVKVLRSEGLNVYDILKYRTLVLLEPAVKNIEGRLRA